jgi:glutathione S-transferase
MPVLRITPRSVFSRKCVMIVHEKDMFEQVSLQNVDLYGDNTDLVPDNPLRKVPALRLDDGTTLFDSPVISEYLDCLDGKPLFHPQDGKERFQALRLQALADGLTEAPQAHSKEVNRPARYMSDALVTKYETAQKRIVGWLEVHFDWLDGPLNIGGLSLACALDYMEDRGPAFDWRSEHKRLAAWYGDIERQPFFTGSTAEANAERLGVSL